jgi:UDP-N-acetylmuramyl tripeptide synthase
MLVLIKNPTGFTESLRSVTHQAYPFQSVAFILNDNLADGQDVSWIWDAPLHKYLPQKLNTVYASGSRALDMALRLSYALPPESSPQIVPNLSELLQTLIQKKDYSIVFTTYTAMLEIQSWLAENKIKNAYWE